MSSIYQYNTFKSGDEIRIFHLQPGATGSPLQCSIEHVRLRDNPQFTAISYVWGSDEKPYSINAGNDQAIHITDSLYTLLRDLRDCRDIAIMTFWIDQICIDQMNNSEKSIQVSLLRDIYSIATEVITYIGPKGPTDDKGLDLAIQIFTIFGSGYEHYLDMTKETANYLVAQLPNWEDSSWTSLHTLLDREWIERRWIVQENIVNRQTRIACGSRLTAWEVFGTYLNLLVRFGIGSWILPNIEHHPSSSHVRRLDSLRRLATLKDEYGQGHPSLLKLLIKEHSLLCREPNGFSTIAQSQPILWLCNLYPPVRESSQLQLAFGAATISPSYLSIYRYHYRLR